MNIISRKEAKLQGLSRYYTGRSCSHGHLSERWVCSHGCIKCRNIRRKTQQNREASIRKLRNRSNERTQRILCIQKFNKSYISKIEATAQELPLYFTGEPCKRGHICERYTLDGNCMECRKFTGIIKEKNKEKIQQYQKEYRSLHNEKLKKQSSIYRNKLAVYNLIASKLIDCECRKTPNGYLEIQCIKCNKWFIPTNKTTQHRIESIKTGKGESNFYCSDICKSTCLLYKFNSTSIDPRSKLYIPKSEQQKARACQTDHLKQLQCDEVGHNYCEKCGDIIDVELHHTLPIAKYGKEAVNSAGHIIICVGCHIMECQ